MLRIVLSFAALLFVLPSHAAVFTYNNGAPNQLNGNEATNWIQAEDFTLANATTLTGVRFWDIETSPGYQGSITWSIYANGASAPGALLFRGNTAVTHTAT